MSEPHALKPVYLITGSDRPKVELAVARLRARFVPEAVERVSAVDATGADAVALCNAGSLLGDARLVVVEDVDGRRNADGRLTGGWKAADVEAVASYLESPAPATTLALVGVEVRKDAPLAKACTRAGDVLDYAVAKRSLPAWVADRFRQRGIRAEPDACAALVHLVGEDLHGLAAEIDKVATWAGDEPVGEREIEQLVAGTADTPSFAITDAWADRDPGRALEASERVFDRSDRPRRDEAARLSAALGGHAAKLRVARRLSDERIPAAKALAQLGTRSTFYAEKLYRQAEGFSDEELRSAVTRLAELDLALKGASKLPPDLEVQRALADLVRGGAERDHRG